MTSYLNVGTSALKVVNGVLLILLLLVCWQLIATTMMPTPILTAQRQISESSKLAEGQWQWFSRSTDNDQKSFGKANLNARVLGVVMKSSQSVALISLPGRPETVYRVGDKINNTTSLEAIEPHRIILRENGVLREIELNDLGANKRTSSSLLTKTASNSTALEILDMARAIPVSVNGVTGLRLNDLAENIQQLSELKNGDIIVSVEGQDVMSLQVDNAWQSLMNKTDAQVNIIRAGEPSSIQVNVAALAQQMMQSLTN